MMNDFFLKESLFSTSEKDYLEEYFMDPSSLKSEKEYKQEEIDKGFLSPLSKTKSEISNKKNIFDSNLIKENTEKKNFNKFFIIKNLKDENEEEKKINNLCSSYKNKANNSNLINKTKANPNTNTIFLINSNNNNMLHNNFSSNKKDKSQEIQKILNLNNENNNNNPKNNFFIKKFKTENTYKYPPIKKNINIKFEKLQNKYIKRNENEDIIQNEEKEDKLIKIFGIKKAIYNKTNKYVLENLEDKCFPFNSGKGIINITSKINYEELEPVVQDSNNNDFDNNSLIDNIDDKNSYTSKEGFYEEKPNEEGSNLKLQDKNNLENNIDDLYLIKFFTKKYYISENGKKKAVKKKRKYKNDIIRKKIKSRFHKTLKNIINNNLKKAGSKKLFDFIPQCFIGNVSKKINSDCLEMTYEELLTTDFGSELCKSMANYINEEIEKKKVLKNKNVLEYLKDHWEIEKKSGFNIIKNMKYKELLNNYFISKEFEDSLYQIKDENEPKEYIQFYIYTAKNYVKYFSKLTPRNYKKHNFEFVENLGEDDDEEEEESL